MTPRKKLLADEREEDVSEDGQSGARFVRTERGERCKRYGARVRTGALLTAKDGGEKEL